MISENFSHVNNCEIVSNNLCVYKHVDLHLHRW